ncbi:hypothetical protein A8V01_18150 [Novosphingobium guangzhouense]|uniref:Uncharacterized protein n=1 Tax=Novosphingobium guangzhouense TaxID=1850347 RepID=A0A2K2G1D1_9SPHN|nr:hypothetical protein A8V01_18150 [Novosphingobium guangzhouense]
MSPVVAQTATCYRLGNVSSCGIRQGTVGDNPAEQRYSSFNEVERLRDKNEAREEVRKEQSLREEVGSQIAEGQCAEARKTALRAGDFELADKAAGMCERQGHR